MNAFLLYAYLGLGAGALYAALAQSVILGYRGSGLVNFGQGAMAMIIAYTYRQLKVSGQLLIPPLPNPLKIIEAIANAFGAHLQLWGIPPFVSLGGPMATVPAVLISLGYAAVLGILVHVLIFRPMRYSSALAKVAASVGIMLTLQAIAALRFGTNGLTVPPILPTQTISVAGSSAPVSLLIVAGLAVLLAAGLASVYRYTRFGLAAEAAAVNERGAIATGLSPDRLAAVSWIISSVIGGAIGILFATLTTITPSNFTFFIVPALGAALLASLRSLFAATVVGLLIGIAQSLLIPLQADVNWLQIPGLANGIPFVVIIIAMMARGKSLPMRGGVMAQKLPACPEPRRIALPGGIIAVLVIAGLLTLPWDLRGGIINSLTGILIALSLLVATGMAGQVSLMQMAIAGASALVMTQVAGNWGVPFPIAPILATLAATVVGVVISLPALRIRGVNLAIATLGAAFAFESLVLDNGSIVGNAQNVGSVPDPTLGSLNFGIDAQFPIGVSGIPSPGFGIFVLVVVTLACALVIGIRRGRSGRAFLAIRSNERSAASVGLNVPGVKVMAFAVSAFLAGLSGAVTAYQFQALNTENYTTLASVTTFAFVYVAGISTISGSLLAGLLFTGGLIVAVITRFIDFGRYEDIVVGVGLIIMAVQNPDGLSILLGSQLAKVRRMLWRRVPQAFTAAAVVGERDNANVGGRQTESV